MATVHDLVPVVDKLVRPHNERHAIPHAEGLRHIRAEGHAASASRTTVHAHGHGGIAVRWIAPQGLLDKLGGVAFVLKGAWYVSPEFL